MRNAAGIGIWWRRVALALVALLCAVGPLAAADLYRIQGVPVDASAESGVAARELAIAQGQREGLTRLMQRLTSPADHGRLPDTSAVPIERFVNSFEIAEEKVGPNQYLGVINVSYIASQVQGLLGSAGVPYVTRRSDPILVVPVTVAGGVADAWSEVSPWRDAWFAAAEDAILAVVVLPLGDLADIAGAPVSALQAGDPAVLEALGVRYGATTVIVATATAADPSLVPPVRIELRRGDDWGQPIFTTTVEADAAPDPATNPTAALEPAVAQAILAIEDDWKLRTAAQAARVTTVAATVPLADLAGWVHIRRDLTALPEVRWVTVDSFTQSRARVTIGHLGDIERLSGAVGRIGLSLAEETEGWLLRPADMLAVPLDPLPDASVTP
jgi:hypothetical protein